MYIIDTDVLSALRNRERNPEVARWLADQRAPDLHLSVVSIGEIERGIEAVRDRDPAFAARMEDWLDALMRFHGDRVLPVDPSVARRWGVLSQQLRHAGRDLLIAATALEHGLTVVTRNVRRFQPTGAAVLDPSSPCEPSAAAGHRPPPRFSGGE